jgi:hypothetical protein
MIYDYFWKNIEKQNTLKNPDCTEVDESFLFLDEAFELN